MSTSGMTTYRMGELNLEHLTKEFGEEGGERIVADGPGEDEPGEERQHRHRDGETHQ